MLNNVAACSFDSAWEKIHAEKPWGQYPSESIIRFMARYYYGSSEERNKIKVLDFGCGAGANTWYLAREGFDVSAFDGSISAVKKTKAKLVKENCNANVDCYDALNLTYNKNFFDCIIDSATIQCNKLEYIYIMYASCYEMLKQGGRILTTCFDVETTGFGTGVEIEHNTFKNCAEGAIQHTGLRHFYTEEELQEILLSVGFRNIEIDLIRTVSHKKSMVTTLLVGNAIK